MTTASRPISWILPLALVIAVLALFHPVLDHGFAPLDDDVNLVFNPHHGPLTGERVRWAFADTSYVRRYFPLGWIAEFAVATAVGLAPFGYHAASLAVHSLNAALLFCLLRRFVRKFAPTGPQLETVQQVAPFLAAAWWALHPLRAETVAWASAFSSNLALTALLLAMWLHLRDETVRSGALGALAFAASLLCYPVAIGAALFFPLLDWAGGIRGRPLFNRANPYLAVAAVVTFVNLSARSGAGVEHAPVPTLAELSLGFRLVRGLGFITHYLWKPWLPWDLAPVYRELLVMRWNSPALLGGLAAAGVVAAFAWRRPGVACLALAFAAVLLPITGFTELIHFPHDRYSLWSDLVWAGGLALLLVRWNRPLGVGLTIGVIAAGSILTMRQIPVWRSTDTILARVRTELAPGDAPAIRDIRPAYWLFREGKYDAADALLDGELAKRPGDPALLTARGELRELRTTHERAAATLGLAPQEMPPVAVLHYGLARQFIERHEPEPAAWHLAEIARIAPKYYERIQRNVRR